MGEWGRPGANVDLAVSHNVLGMVNPRERRPVSSRLGGRGWASPGLLQVGALPRGCSLQVPCTLHQGIQLPARSPDERLTQEQWNQLESISNCNTHSMH